MSLQISTLLTTTLVLLALLFTSKLWSQKNLASVGNTVPLKEIIIPGPAKGFARRNIFVEELLAKILAIQNLPITVKYFEGSLPQSRALHELQHNRSINLNWSMSTKARENKLQAIKIPIYKNMIGWRVLAIRTNEQARFSRVANLEDLQQFTAVQRHDWPDYRILKFNALPVEGQFPFTHIPKAINQGLADYFPRSVLEVAKERHWYQQENLMLETSLLLKYDAAYYFFVSKDNKSLAKLIENGFQMLLDNGEFDRLFNAHFGDSIATLGLAQRTVLTLKNPYF